jgi:protein arginine N-methyltransferase 1
MRSRSPEHGRHGTRGLARLEGLLLLHEALLADRARNRAFLRALQAAALRDATVLDVGSGSGVWAVTAARLGARRVVAVEREALLVPVIRRLAAENGVADRIEIVQGDSRRLRLRREFDLVVSETVGNWGFDEDVVPVLADACARFLRPNGVLIPRALALLARPVRLRRRAGASVDGLAVTARSLRGLSLHVPRPAAARDLQPLAPPARLIDVDLRRAPARLPLTGLRGEWRLRDAGRIDGFALWVEMTLAPGVVLSTLSGTHWNPTLFPVEPLVTSRGLLRLALTLGPGPVRWEASWTAGGKTETTSYSSRFAYGSLAPHLERRRRIYFVG